MPFNEARQAMFHSRSHSEIAVMDYDEDEFGELLYQCEARFESNEPEGTEGVHVFFGKDGGQFWCVHMRHETEAAKAAKAAYAEAMAAEADDSIGEG